MHHTFTNDFVLFLAAVEEIFKIGSMSPGAMLFEAAKEFQRKSQRADEYIRMIKDKLDRAVDECIDAAGQEFEPSQQKALLRVNNSFILNHIFQLIKNNSSKKGCVVVLRKSSI